MAAATAPRTGDDYIAERARPFTTASRSGLRAIFNAMPFGASSHFVLVETLDDVFVNLGKLRDVLHEHAGACEQRDRRIYEFEQQRDAIRAYLGTTP